MQKIIRIGTRDSQLALWQANKVSKELEELGYQTEIVPNSYKGLSRIISPVDFIGTI